MNTVTAWLVRALIAAHFLLLAVLDIGTVALILRVEGALIALTFAARYSRTTWAQSAEGRHLMAFTVLVVAFLTTASVGSILGDYPGRPFVLLALYGLLAWLLWDRLLLLLTAQRRGTDDPEETP